MTSPDLTALSALLTPEQIALFVDHLAQAIQDGHGSVTIVVKNHKPRFIERNLSQPMPYDFDKEGEK